MGIINIKMKKIPIISKDYYRLLLTNGKTAAIINNIDKDINNL